MRSLIASRVALLPLLLAASAACSGTEDLGEKSSAPVGQTEQAIYGGTNTTKYPFVLGMISTSGPGGICTATLIAPNLALTARHCVSETNSEYIDCQTSKFTTDASASELYVTVDNQMSQQSDFLAVRKVLLPTDKTMCGHDMALLILADNIPDSVAKPAIPKIHEKITDGEGIKKITAIGYGISDPGDQNGQTAGTRRIRENIPVLCAYDHPSANQDCLKVASQEQRDALITESDLVVSEGTCQGDSGSSAFEQDAFDADTYYSVGVLSRGAAGTCDVGVYTRVDAFADFLVDGAKQAAELGDYDPPSWVDGSNGASSSSGGSSGASSSSGSSGGSDKTALGEECEENADCDSDLCTEIDGSNVCSVTCEDSCEDEGFECNGDGYCVASAESSSSSSSGSGGDEKSGCSVATDPTKPIPWRNGTGAVALAFGVSLLLRRRSKS